MAPPHNNVTVATGALRSHVGLWAAEGAKLSELSAKVGELHISRIEAGFFQVFISTYNTLVTEVAQRCQEGNAAMGDIAKTLRSVADVYDEEERKNVHKIKGLY
jgi:hypothetical protein